jgi:hypothetical protein
MRTSPSSIAGTFPSGFTARDSGDCKPAGEVELHGLVGDAELLEHPQDAQRARHRGVVELDHRLCPFPAEADAGGDLGLSARGAQIRPPAVDPLQPRSTKVGLDGEEGVDMHYMLLIYDSEREWEAASEAERARMMCQHEALERDLRVAGRYAGCGALASATTATTIRRGGAKPLVTDGPFAETREQLGGYYIIEAPSLDEAIDYAGRLLLTPQSAIEVRPIAAIRT